MYSVYEQNNQVIEAKLRELTEVLARISEYLHTPRLIYACIYRHTLHCFRKSWGAMVA